MSSQHILSGSNREHPANSVHAGVPAHHERITITLLLRRRAEAPAGHDIEKHLSHVELADAFGADADDVRAVKSFAAKNGFEVEKVHIGSRTVVISGERGRLAKEFGADLHVREIGGKKFHTRAGHLSVPASLEGRVVAVLGFDERPAASTNHRVHARSAAPQTFTPLDLAGLYNFPQGTGAGQTIAIIELGGGYTDSDLQSYWSQLGISPVSVSSVPVDGADNAPTGDPNGADGEVLLDIEVAGALAPEANIAVYFGPNTDQGFLNAINAAIHDAERKPSVISISWGSGENEWTGQSKFAFNSAFHDAALLGITVLAAAGDNGSSDGEDTGLHVDFPASSPWVLACGGTSLIASNGTIVSETVWNDGTNGGATGGGVSNFFSRPAYQAHASVPFAPNHKAGRGVPDVAAVADPETGYDVIIDGQRAVIGGTSAVAPLWAGLVAICNQELGTNLGWMHSALYGTVAKHKVLHDITSGTNGAYSAKVGWDCCTGLGTPDGQALLKTLRTWKKR